MLEGTVAAVPPKGGRKHPEQNLININTKNILFICGGAFIGLDKIISGRLGKRNIGFGADLGKSRLDDKINVLRHVEPEDLLKFGLIPEFVGRLPIIAVLDDLNEDALLDILVKPKNALTKQYKRLFEMDDVELEIEQDALTTIVKLAKKRGAGARGLRAIFEDIMLDLMYDIPSRRDIKQCILTKDFVLKKAPPIYDYKQVKKSA
jgi:ATP-dependent Clp protease ATP-binding subunit ClpX